MFMSDLSIIVRCGYVFASRLLKDYDISGGEQPILMYLAGNPNTNQDAIAKHYMIDKGAVAKTLAKLEEKGFVQREINPENQREKFISLTEKGRESIGHLNRFLNTWNELLFKGICDEDARLFEKIINEIANNAIAALDVTENK